MLKPSFGTLVPVASAAEAARASCTLIVDAISAALSERPYACIALSGGSSPLATYRLLAEQHLEWSRIHVFWVDERAVPPDHERSNYFQARRALLEPAQIPEGNIHSMAWACHNVDLEVAAKRYESTLRQIVKPGRESDIPRFDLQVLGLGTDGHTASMFPGDATHTLTDQLVAAVPAAVGREARLTLTAPVITHAATTLAIITGADKREALHRVWASSGTLDETPARIINNVQGATFWVVDNAARQDDPPSLTES